MGSFNRKGPVLGFDGPIPATYRPQIAHGIEIAWRLDDNRIFVRVFRDTIAKLSGRKLSRASYSVALNKMVINTADTSKNPRVLAEVAADDDASRKDKRFQKTPAFSFVDGRDIWIRMFDMAGGPRRVAANIVHEACHLVGAPGDPLRDANLYPIHDAAGLPR
jgi:hypothetical protein